MAPTGKAPDSSAVEALNKTIDAALSVIQAVLVIAREAYDDAKKAKEAIAQKSDSTTSSSFSSSSSATWDPPTEFNAFALARDASTLIRAHGTKISLLMINEPFTPSAIGTVIKELDSAILSLGTAAQQCYGDRYTNHVRQEMARRCMSVLEQTQHLLNAIPRDGRVVPEAQRTGGAGTGTSSRHQSKAMADRGSYTKIGILWAECDSLVAFCKGGVDGFLVQVVTQLAEQLKDEQEELREWGDEEDDGDDEDGDGFDDGNVSDSGYDDGEEGTHHQNDNEATQAMLDALMNTRHIPPDDPNGLRPRLEAAIKKIRLVLLLCRAVTKRRLTKPALPALPAPTPEGNIAPRLDGAIAALQTTVNRFEDLAAAFYKLDAAEVDTVMGQCFDAAVSVSSQLSRPFVSSADASSDPFTDWAAKFESEIRVVAPVAEQ
ncbi:hypothetical protein SEUCBS140593_008441 [Sporothrix eucalyptigena]|uniref:Cyclin-D1-binding protein 1-like N-terminal domain-containing protein n=1 Tax=Sporothrix eucalyptigena TaxID=1812306 RepID=A0ABP0CLI4_9PEZI